MIREGRVKALVSGYGHRRNAKHSTDDLFASNFLTRAIIYSYVGY